MLAPLYSVADPHKATKPLEIPNYKRRRHTETGLPPLPSVPVAGGCSRHFQAHSVSPRSLSVRVRTRHATCTPLANRTAFFVRVQQL